MSLKVLSLRLLLGSLLFAVVFACVQTSPISFVVVVPFPRATKEIGDVCTQATVVSDA